MCDWSVFMFILQWLKHAHDLKVSCPPKKNEPLTYKTIEYKVYLHVPWSDQ